MRSKLLLFFIFSTACSLAQTVSVKTDLVYKVNMPAKKTDKVPVIILLHGYGSNESDLFDMAKSFDGRFMTFSLRAPYPAAGGQGYSWFDLEFLPDKQFKYDYKQAKESRSKIFSFISNACKAYKLDSTQVFVMGYSQGAVMGYDLAFSNPQKIKGLLALSGFMMPETKELKTDPLKLAKVNFFIAHGSQDNVVDFKQAEQTSAWLKEKQCNVTFNSYMIPHAINGTELNDIKSWLKSAIPKEKKAEPGK